MKYRKKPVVIDAFELGNDPMPDWFMDAVTRNDVILHMDDAVSPGAEIVTLEGVHWAQAQTYERQGDRIIRGVKGELYPCKSDIFAATYEAVEVETRHDWKFTATGLHPNTVRDFEADIRGYTEAEAEEAVRQLLRERRCLIGGVPWLSCRARSATFAVRAWQSGVVASCESTATTGTRCSALPAVARTRFRSARVPASKLESASRRRPPMPEQAKIEGCPFCGGECWVDMFPADSWFAACRNTESCSYLGTERATEAEAVAAHNRVAVAVRLFPRACELLRHAWFPEDDIECPMHDERDTLLAESEPAAGGGDGE